jgi:hypothetical protein
VPTGQLVHKLDPDDEEYVPEEQLKHNEVPELCSYIPAVQLEQELAPMLAKVPAEQIAQSDDAVFAW